MRRVCTEAGLHSPSRRVGQAGELPNGKCIYTLYFLFFNYSVSHRALLGNWEGNLFCHLIKLLFLISCCICANRKHGKRKWQLLHMRGVVFAVGIVKSLKAKRGFSKDTGEGSVHG